MAGVFDVKIVEHIGVLAEYKNGWKKEVNIVEWNGGRAKIDIRDWSPDHENMSRGITLYDEEAKALCDCLTKYFEA